MKFYKNAKTAAGFDGVIFNVSTIDENSFKLNLFKKSIDENKSSELDISFIIDKETISKDVKSKSNIDSPHSVACLFGHDDGTLKSVDFFKHSNHNKSSIGSVKTLLDIYPLVFAFIPFSDSKMSECTFVINSTAVNVDGKEIDEINLDFGVSISNAANQILPSISLSKNGNEIVAQLNPVKVGVEIYFETTAGYLNKTRALTDATGKATVKVFGDELEGKVKAGFKHFSGKAEVNI